MYHSEFQKQTFAIWSTIEKVLLNYP